MTTTSVGVPFPVYTDTSGDPVDAGYLYLGVAGLNPEVNPIQAYWNTELTIPATQPIRTSGGYPMRGGSPGRLYVAAANYSIMLKDRASRLVWSSLNGEGLGVDLQIQLAFSTTLFTAVGGETVLSTGEPYTSELLYVDQNGLGLYSGVHFTETTSTTITLTTAAVAGDVFRLRVGQLLGGSSLTALEARLSDLEAETSMTSHVAAADPHPGYITTAELAAVEAGLSADIAAIPDGLGVGQTWQDVKASRALNVWYTNSTGKPIQVNIDLVLGALGLAYLKLSTDGGATSVDVCIMSTSELDGSASAIVPDGHSYQLASTVAVPMDIWAELR